EGEESDWTREVRAFGERLAQRTGLPVHYVDERLTSVRAERTVRSLGLPKRERERKTRVDTIAAMLLLQAYLDGRARGCGGRTADPDHPGGVRPGRLRRGLRRRAVGRRGAGPRPHPGRRLVRRGHRLARRQGPDPRPVLLPALRTDPRRGRRGQARHLRVPAGHRLE